jgi:hypothetical protein
MVFCVCMSSFRFFLFRSGTLTVEQTDEWMDEIKAKALEVKQEMDTANEGQEKDLHKKLSQFKIAALSDMVRMCCTFI